MTQAAGSFSQMAYIKETTWGTTPTSTPEMTKVEVVNQSLGIDRSSIESNSIRSDRNVNFHLNGNEAIKGSVNTELVYKMFDDWIESVMYAAWATDVIKNGVTQKSLSLEKQLTDIDQYFMHAGIIANNLGISIAPNAIVTANFDFIGKSEAVATTDWKTANTGTYATPTDWGTNPMDSFTGTLKEGGSTIAIVTALDFAINNGLTENNVIMAASRAPNSISAARCRVSGTLTSFVEDVALYNKFVNGTESSLELVLEEENSGIVTNNKYTILFPRIKYTGAKIDVGGEGPLTNPMPFVALYDDTELCSIKITRADATDV